MWKRNWLIFTLLISASVVQGAGAFGTRRTHEGLADRARGKADEGGSISAYLRSELGLREGVDEPLAIQFGLDARIDADLIVRDDPTTTDVIETRLNQSLSWRDEDENGNRVHYPDAPEDTFVSFKRSSCREAPDFDACFAALTRAPIDRLLRIGTYAEDNPNPRSQHHFHDPERSRPIVGHGLDNSSALSDSILGVLALEVTTTLARGGSWLRAITGVLTSPFRPFSGGVGNFDLRGRSAVDRALNTSGFGGFASEEYPANLFSLPDAERYLYLALTSEPKDERENYLALHFVALGHVLHLLQDMASVAHVRNDFIFDHVIVDEATTLFTTKSLESSADREAVFTSVRDAVGTSLASVPAATLEDIGSGTAPLGFFQSLQAELDPGAFDVSDFWDRGDFSDPDDSDPSHAGLAERVHNRFFSAGSISNVALSGGYEHPKLLDCGAEPGSQLGSGPDAVRVDDLPERKLEDGKAAGSQHRFLASPLVPHLARCRYHALYAEGPYTWSYTVTDQSVQRDYLELLFPLAIEYGAKFLQHYLAPRIEVVPAGDGEFTLRNLTMLPFAAHAEAVEIDYVTAVPGEYGERRRRVPVQCGSGTLVLPPAPSPEGRGPLGDFTCQMPSSLPEPALDASDFWVVVRGSLGQRGEVATPAEFDTGIAPKDFVVAFDHVRPEILYQSKPPLREGETDEISRSNLAAIAPDFSSSITSAEASPTPRDLGLRSAVAQRFNLNPAQIDRLDFLSPSAEPGGARIALAMDVDEAGTVHDSPNDVWILDLTKELDDADALRVLPKLNPRLVEGLQRWVAWNRDGFSDDLVFGATDPATQANDLVGHDVTSGASAPLTSGFYYFGSLHGAVLAGIPQAVGNPGGDVSDIHLVNLDSGVATHRFELGTLEVEPCAPTGCTVGSSTAPAQEGEPEFSADGTQVAFISAPVGEAGYTGGKLYVADLNRSVDTIFGGSLRRVGGVERATSPIWSPDGEWIVYQDNTVRDLFAIRAIGGDPIRLTHTGTPLDGTGTLQVGNLTWLSPLALPSTP